MAKQIALEIKDRLVFLTIDQAQAIVKELQDKIRRNGEPEKVGNILKRMLP